MNRLSISVYFKFTLFSDSQLSKHQSKIQCLYVDFDHSGFAHGHGDLGKALKKKCTEKTTKFSIHRFALTLKNKEF
jgi:hypothetical protein